MVSRDAVLTVFVASISLALAFSFYSEIYEAYLEPDHANVSTSPLNDTRRASIMDEGMVIISYYYRNDCPVCRQQTPIMDELAESLNDTIFLEKVNVRTFPQDNITAVPTLHIMSSEGYTELVGLTGPGKIAREIIEQIRVMENAADPPR